MQLVVSFPNPLALESGLVERTPKNGLIWLWSLILRKNCIKPLVLGISLASHTPKLSVSTAETSFCLILEPQSPFFFQPPVWDKFNPQFGTQFISISLDFHSYLFISTGQIVVQGVACWSTSAYFDNVSGINKQWIQSIIKVHPTCSASHHSLPNLFIFFCFPWAEPRPLSYCLLQSRFSCDSDSWAVINNGHGFRQIAKE